MGDEIHPRAGVVLLAVFVLMVSSVAAASTFTASGGVTYETDTGLETTVSYDHDVGTSNPFTANDTVEIVNTTVSGDGGAVSIDAADGAFLNTSSITTNGNNITIDGEDESAAIVRDDFDALDISDVTIDPKDTQLVYTTGSESDITLTGLPSDESYIAVVDGDVVSGGDIETDGTLDLTLPAATDGTLTLLGSTPPTIDSEAAAPTGRVDDRNVTFSAPVSDDDFGVGDNVTVNISVDGNVSSTQTITEPQTVTYSENLSLGGSHTWQMSATDAAGNTVVSDAEPSESGSQPFSFDLPARLAVRPVDDTSSVITGSDVSVTFFGSEEVATRSDDDGDGKVDFQGLPVDERFEAVVNASGYEQRTVVVPSLFEQQSVYLLDSDATIVRPRFEIESSNSDFPEDSSEIIIERPVTVDGQQEYATITAAEPGISGFDIALEQDQRYRITVRAPNGDTRQLGSFTPTATERVVLEITDAGFEPDQDTDSVTLNAEWQQEDDADPQIAVDIAGENVVASSVTITERENDTVVFDDSFAGSASTTIPAQEGTEYVVDMTAERELNDGSTETFNKTSIVSDGQIGAGGGVPDRWKTLFAFATLLVIGGLFTRANAGIGAITVAGIGGIFWVVGWLPAIASGLSVALAMMIGVVSYAISQQRGAPT